MTFDIVEVGHVAVILALMLSLVGVIAPILGLRNHNGAWIVMGRQAVTLIFILLAIAMGTMIYSYLIRDFSVKYIAATSNSKLPLFYTVAALWGGHEGSLLLWVFILSAFCTTAVWLHWRTQPATIPYLIIVESALMFGFLALIIFLSNPFERLIPAAPDGKDLNPLLQDPAMVMHPPMLYMGYVGFSIPFAFAMASLFSGRLGEEWLKVTQRWTIFAWLCLTTGILMGGYWAYYELGWGGYWGWDPVENASFMPWLVGTAFLHSAMVQEKRKMFKVWNLFLIIMTFSLSLIGTFLVRSGVLTSVHSFATDPGRGLYILLFLATVMSVAFGTLIVRSPKLKSLIQLDSIVSRESVFLFNNLFFLVAMFTVFLGTLYPLMVETLGRNKVTVGPPYYNAVFMPIALGLVFLMGIGPSIAWRKASTENLRKNFLLPLIIGLATLTGAAVAGVRSPLALGGLAIVGFVAATITFDFGKLTAFWAARQQINLFAGFLTAFAKNQRRWAGLVTHFGVLILIIGVISSTIYQTEKVVTMRVGDQLQLGPYTIQFKALHAVTGANWTAQEGVMEVSRGDRFIAELRPQKRMYDVSMSPTTEAAIHTIHTGQIFVTMPEVTPDGIATVRALINPLVLWVWGGGAIMGIGVLLNLFRPKRDGT
jgi:cytochrome c-type biogenesis protein CcmF